MMKLHFTYSQNNPWLNEECNCKHKQFQNAWQENEDQQEIGLLTREESIHIDIDELEIIIRPINSSSIISNQLIV